MKGMLVLQAGPVSRSWHPLPPELDVLQKRLLYLGSSIQQQEHLL